MERNGSNGMALPNVLKDLGLDGKEWFKWYGITQCIKQKQKKYSK
jgi:hypothetical protein